MIEIDKITNLEDGQVGYVPLKVFYIGDDNSLHLSKEIYFDPQESHYGQPTGNLPIRRHGDIIEVLAIPAFDTSKLTLGHQPYHQGDSFTVVVVDPVITQVTTTTTGRFRTTVEEFGFPSLS